jgi:hypothetical protein
LRHDPVMESGVATRAELQLERSPGYVDSQVAAKRWRRLNDDVVALHNGPLTKDQARLAVYLSAQQPAALCGLTAAEMCGLRGFETDHVHIVVRRGARVLTVPGVSAVVHESRRFTADDVATRYAPARVAVERAVVDAAVWSPQPAQAGRLLAAAVQQRLTSPAALSEALELAGRVRHRRVLRLLLVDLEGGAQAMSEVEFRRFCRRHGFPTPAMNVRVEAGGRRRYLDAVLTARNGGVVRIEIDGGVHLSLTARWADTRRDNALALRGIHLLRFPSVAIYTDDPEAVQQIRSALQRVSS